MKESVNLFSGRITPEYAGIEIHKFTTDDNKVSDCGDYVELTYPDYFESSGFCGSIIDLYKRDVIALAKHFKLNAHDIGCSEHIALQKYCQKLEDEIINLSA